MRDILKEINEKLDEIEKRENVRILHAVESGSRAWGFASPDSDYDVRFIYVRSAEDYLQLDEPRDVIEWQLDEVLDINGWDLRKALKQFAKGNATLFEWSGSPIVYRTTPQWKRITEVSKQYFSEKSAIYHYYGTANSTYNDYLTGEMVRYKKYFYALRPLMAAMFIEENHAAPPVLFDDLMKMEIPGTLRGAIEELLEIKKRTTEKEENPQLPVIRKFIEDEVARQKVIADETTDDHNKDMSALNKVFLEVIGMTDKSGSIDEKFEFRSVKPEEALQAVEVEHICFPPHEACSKENMTARIKAAGDFFQVAIDRETGKIAGFLNGIATDEYAFRDDFFTDPANHNPNGENVMIAGLVVRPEYRKMGLARALVEHYRKREKARGRKRLVLTCLDEKVGMYLDFGFRDLGESGSVWAGEKWHEMDLVL